MCNHSAFAVLLAAGLILNYSGSHSATSHTKSNSNDTVFKFLLGLYKINPLKRSPVFQSFSEDLLMGMGRGKNRDVLNSESSESVIVNKNVKTNLKEIDEIIHTKNNKPGINIEKPAYDLGDVVSTENFKAELVVNDKVLSKEEFQRTILDNHNMIYDVSSLLDHIGSNETDNEAPVTKLLPVKNPIVRYSQVTNDNEVVFEFADSKDNKDNKVKSDNHVDTLPKTRDRNPKDKIPMNNFVDGVEDVIVF